MAQLWLSGSIVYEDITKLHKLDLPNVKGIEFGFLNDKSELDILKSFITERNMQLGLHHPVIKYKSIGENSNNISLDKCITSHIDDVRKNALESVHNSLALAAEYNAKYLVIHAPGKIKGTDKLSLTKEQYVKVVNESLFELDKMSHSFGVPIILESDGPNIFYNTPEDFVNLLKMYPNLKHCLDTLHFAVLTGKYKYPCSVKALIDATAPYTFSMHLSNTISPSGTGKDARPLGSEHLRLPAHPSQKPCDGFVDIDYAIKKVLDYNPDCLLVLEHLPYRDFELSMLEQLGYGFEAYSKESYEWIKTFC